jgi:hypothetical protein
MPRDAAGHLNTPLSRTYGCRAITQCVMYGAPGQGQYGAPSSSDAYMLNAMRICRSLLVQVVCRALRRVLAYTGKIIAARIAMIAITTSNSISVNPRHVEADLA